MAVNQVNASNGQITLSGDHVVHHQSNVTFELTGDRLPEMLKHSHKGDMFITNLKLIFVNKGKGFNTFSMDFQYIRNFEVKQPIFGANFLKAYVKAEPNGGWEGSANFRIDFPKGGAIEFAEEFQKAVKNAIRYRNSGMQPVPPGPPPMMYGQPPMMQPGYYYPPPQQPPMGSTYAYQPGMPPGAVPPPTFTHPVGQAPPPYQNAAQSNMYPTIQGQSESANAKANEAYMSGNNVYVPNNDAPPPYNPNYDKKDQ